MKHVRHTFLFMLVWAVFLNGCSSWKTVELRPEADPTSTVRVTLKDGSRVETKNAYVNADTLFGHGHVVIPIQDIEKVEEKHSSPPKTAGLTLGIIAVVVLLGLAYVAGGVADAAS